MKIALMVPVKDLSNAKTRLDASLSPDERKELAWRMLRKTLSVVAQLRNADRKVIVTHYPPAISLAEELGLEVLLEDNQVSESHSVDRASEILETQGVDGVLRVPLDLPLIRVEDLECLINWAKKGEHVILSPSRDGTGTNAIFRNPPTLFSSQFGHGSLVKHAALSNTHQIKPLILSLPTLSLDIDDPADARELLSRDGFSPAAKYLLEIGFSDRVESP